MGNDGCPPKREGGYQEIILVKVVWKVCATVVNCHINSSVKLNNKIHGLRAGRGTETATLEANLAQQLAGIAHEPLSQVSWT